MAFHIGVFSKNYEKSKKFILDYVADLCELHERNGGSPRILLRPKEVEAQFDNGDSILSVDPENWRGHYFNKAYVDTDLDLQEVMMDILSCVRFKEELVAYF